MSCPMGPMGWDGMENFVLTIPWDGMGQTSLSHGTIFSSHPIPFGDLVDTLSNYDKNKKKKIRNSIIQYILFLSVFCS